MSEYSSHLDQSSAGFENILFITVDALRYDAFEHVSSMDEFNTFNELTKNGISFENHFSVASPTQFSFSSLLSSRFPLDDNGYDHGVADRPVVVSECFAEGGFHTQAFSNCREMSLYQGYDRGFSDFFYYTDATRIMARIGFDLDRLRSLIRNEDISESDAIEYLKYSLDRLFPAIKRHINSVDFRDNREKKSDQIFSPYSRYDEEFIDRINNNYEDFEQSPEMYSQKLLEGEDAIFSNITDSDEISSLGLKDKLILKSGWIKKVLAEESKISEVLSNPKNTIYPFYQAWEFEPSRVPSISSSGKIVKDVVDNIENTESGLFQWIHFYDVHDRLFYSYDCDSKIKNEITEHQRKLNSIDKIPKPLVSDPGYFYSLSYVDHNINKIINELRRNNILDETLIVLTSDHGIPLNAKPQDRRENYFEEAFHVVNFYDEFYHIPLVFYNPKIPTNEVTKLTSSIDVSPTLVNAGGLKAPKEFRGENLFTHPGRDYVMFEHFGRGLGIHGVKKPRVAVRSPNWKIIMEFSPNGPVSSGEIREIYDLQNDPNETNNIKEHRNEEISELIDQVRHRAEEILDNTSRI